jgi:hypothetical protein
VPHQAERRVEGLEVEIGRALIEDVFPDRLARAAVRQRVIPHGDTGGKRPQESLVVRGEHLTGPEGDIARVAGEPAERHAAQRRLVVVSHQAEQVGQGANPLDALVGVGAVADQVAEAPDRVDRAGIGHHGVERRGVGMDIGNDEHPHGSDGSTEARGRKVGR